MGSATLTFYFNTQPCLQLELISVPDIQLFLVDAMTQTALEDH